MVIEPAKGEYKDVFGMNKDIPTDVYGTNPQMTPLLRINPFRFPETIHVYEHMDRLVEIFNVCWPMYAAMPAVLKAALENAYVTTGWDLKKSVNTIGVNVYPTFATVAQEVKKYIDNSEYSDENKGNYKGALVTRLESMTNGINGMIFCADDLSDEELFDKNVIVDLSRVGSMETKALIMGVLVMRLQEYRSGTSCKNSKLKHITVLEEAHNLLKRTSTEQSAEGSNLLGKSVEMLSNSIAEMRTYGEAFIIADQAPGLLDMSVIRNTNTKVILRLPDYSDRELVGKSANLNEEQIAELAKLKTGVAAVYQNNWVSPVLCQFDRYEADEKVYVKPDRHDISNVAESEISNIIMKSDVRKQLDNVDYQEKIVRDIVVSTLPEWLKVKILTYLKTDGKKVKELAQIAYHFFNAKTLDLKRPPRVIFYYGPQGDCGAYNRANNTIKINMNMIDNPQMVISTIAHETWHAYQYQCAEISQTRKDALYAINFINYIRPVMVDGNWGMFEEYESQLVEAEANAFGRLFEEKVGGK